MPNFQQTNIIKYVRESMWAVMVYSFKTNSFRTQEMKTKSLGDLKNSYSKILFELSEINRYGYNLTFSMLTLVSQGRPWPWKLSRESLSFKK